MLKVTNLRKVYPKSDRVAVDDISFELRPGEIFGFLGQNGAGKSTTIKFSNTYSVAETVIVGSVPDNYTYFSNGEDMKQNAEDYIMNNG